MIRMAKEALNGIDPVDVNRSYRFEQGFTMELNLAGVSDEHRDAFAGTDKAAEEVSMPSKLMTAEEVVARIRARDDRRHRWLGLAAQADGPGPRDPAQRPDRPPRSCPTPVPTSACSSRRARPAT